MGVFIQSIWQFLQSQWIQSDLASWLAVGIAIMALFFALRKPTWHTELNLIKLILDTDGGPISMELELSTYSHAPRLISKACLKIDGVNYPMKLESPLKMPTNVQYAILNTFHLRFTGQFTRSKTAPKTAIVDVQAQFSDGSKARLRRKVAFDYDKSGEPTI